LAETYVAADQAVHGNLAFHIAFDFIDRHDLVGRFHEGERVLEFGLPRRIRAERVALGRLPRGIQFDELGGDVTNRFAGLALALVPVAAAQPIQRRLLAADIPADLV